MMKTMFQEVETEEDAEEWAVVEVTLVPERESKPIRSTMMMSSQLCEILSITDKKLKN